MHAPFGRRLVVAAAAVAAAIAAAAPAYAAGSSFDVVLPDVTVAAGASTPIMPIVYSATETEFTGLTATFELTGDLTGVALHDSENDSADCTGGATKLTCTLPWETIIGPYGSIGDVTADLTATVAALGKTGKIVTTVSADGVAKVSTTADLTVAEGVDLAAGESAEITAAPGDKFDAKLTVGNNTDKPVHGAAVIFNTDYPFANSTDYSNCFYADGQINTCVFDTELAPGAAYRTSVPYQLRPDTFAPSNVAGEFEWLTPGDYDDFLTFLDKNGYEGPGKPGTGAKLELTKAPAARSLAKQTDIDPENNWQSLSIQATGKQGTDFAAVGATVTGDTGATVTVPVGVRNNGPATLDRSRAGESAVVAIVTIPDGTTVVSAPEDCVSSADDGSLQTNPKAVQYGCFSSSLFPVKTTVTWDFKLKLNKQITAGEGLVEVNPPCECDRFDKDLDKSNDTAKFVINPIAGGGDNGAGGNGGTGGGTGTGGQGGGGLPITGPQTGLIGGAGALLIAAGVAGFLVARRRRTHFEA